MALSSRWVAALLSIILATSAAARTPSALRDLLREALLRPDQERAVLQHRLDDWEKSPAKRRRLSAPERILIALPLFTASRLFEADPSVDVDRSLYREAEIFQAVGNGVPLIDRLAGGMTTFGRIAMAQRFLEPQQGIDGKESRRLDGIRTLVAHSEARRALRVLLDKIVVHEEAFFQLMAPASPLGSQVVRALLWQHEWFRSLNDSASGRRLALWSQWAGDWAAAPFAFLASMGFAKSRKLLGHTGKVFAAVRAKSWTVYGMYLFGTYGAFALNGAWSYHKRSCQRVTFELLWQLQQSFGRVIDTTREMAKHAEELWDWDFAAWVHDRCRAEDLRASIRLAKQRPGDADILEGFLRTRRLAGKWELWHFIGELDEMVRAAERVATGDWTIARAPSRGDKGATVHFRGLWPVHVGPTQAVRNDLDWGAGKGHLLLTGANTSGKSVLGRGIAANLLLAHTLRICSAEQATVAPLAVIRTALLSQENPSAGLSSFHGKMRWMRKTVARLEALAPEEKAVVLTDELFQGTDDEQALRVARGFLGRLTSLPTGGVLSLVATHRRELAGEDSLVPVWLSAQAVGNQPPHTLQKGISPEETVSRLIDQEWGPVGGSGNA